jgi:hypothetical protein
VLDRAAPDDRRTQAGGTLSTSAGPLDVASYDACRLDVHGSVPTGSQRNAGSGAGAAAPVGTGTTEMRWSSPDDAAVDPTAGCHL